MSYKLFPERRLRVVTRSKVIDGKTYSVSMYDQPDVDHLLDLELEKLYATVR